MQVRSRRLRLAEHLATKDTQRLTKMETLFDSDGFLHLSSALRALYPGRPRARRIAALERLGENIEEAALIGGESLFLRFDRGHPAKNTVDNLQCWFEGHPDPDQPTSFPSSQCVPTPHILSEEQFFNGKQVVHYFVMLSLEPELVRHAEDLLKRLQRHFGYTARFHVIKWSAKDIDVGAEWHEQIQRAIAECQFGLMLISPEFLGSAYIQEHELPKFIATDGTTPEGGKMAVPVALTPFAMDSRRNELRGIERRQIFFGACRGKPIAYSRCHNKQARDQFALELYERILRLLEQKFGN